MPGKKFADNLDVRFLVRAILAWAASAAILTPLAALILSKSGAGEGTIGYVSSALSFLTACFAGSFAMRHRHAGGLYTGLVTAAVLTVLLLTAGFIAVGADIESSAVLSVVTFTFSGCLVGSVILHVSGKKNKKTALSPRRR